MAGISPCGWGRVIPCSALPNVLYHGRMKRCAVRIFLVFGLLIHAEAFAAPAFDEVQRETLRELVAVDVGSNFDRGPALYLLLGNAEHWLADDFSGEGGAAIAPTPDYNILRTQPEETIGNVFVIEGYFIEQVRYPDPEGEGRQQLIRSLWGDQLTRWAINTSAEGKDPDQTVLVYFVDPEGEIVAPERDARVRVAARFYKAWEVPNQDGQPFKFLTFVGGAHEVVDTGLVGGSKKLGVPPWVKVGLVVLVAGLFYGMRYMLNRKQAGSANSAMLRAVRRRDRELSEMDEEDEIDEDLPENPGEALAYLKNHKDD